MKGVVQVATKAKPEKPPIQMTVDDKWLAEYAEKVKSFGGTIEEYEREDIADQADLSDVVEQQEDAAKKDKDLNAALQRGKQQARKEQALHKRAQKMDAASKEREAREQEKEREAQRKEAERKEEEKRAKSIRDVRHVTQGINRALENNVQPAIERAATLPTVGGIGLMVGILLVLLFVVVPVNAQGDTRLKQFWYMLNGRAKLQGAVSPQTGSQVVGGTPVPGSLTPGPGGTLLGPGIQLPQPDGTCPPGTHQIRGSAGNLLCQQDGATGGGPGISQNGTFRTTPTNLGF